MLRAILALGLGLTLACSALNASAQEKARKPFAGTYQETESGKAKREKREATAGKRKGTKKARKTCGCGKVAPSKVASAK